MTNPNPERDVVNSGMGEFLAAIESDIEVAFSDIEDYESVKEKVIHSIRARTERFVSLAALQERLRILYEYELSHLKLLKEYKEEIKFASSLQEDLRKERTKFFSESLKDVSQTLKDAQVDSKVASTWIRELVGSFTRSIELSGSLVEEHTLDTISEIRLDAQTQAQALKATSGQ